MDNAIKNVEGDEARSAAFHFMAQQMGALKELDKNIISRNPTLQGMTLDPDKVIASIPQGHQQPQPAPRAPEFAAPALFMHTAASQAAQPQQPVMNFLSSPKKDDQMEFDFSYDMAKDIVSRLERLEKISKAILEAINKQVPPLKKT